MNVIEISTPNEARNHPMLQGLQPCTWHNTHHPSSEFSNPLYPLCKVGSKDNDLRRNYSISLDDYNSMLAAQNYGCSLCGKSESENGKKLAVDHWHGCRHQPTDKHKSCGRCIRSLLCNTCNLKLTESWEAQLSGMSYWDVERFGFEAVRQWKYIMHFYQRMQENIPPHGLDHFPNDDTSPDLYLAFREVVSA